MYKNCEIVNKVISQDKERLTHVLVNLISNSIKFSNEGTIFVNVEQIEINGT